MDERKLRLLAAGGFATGLVMTATSIILLKDNLYLRKTIEQIIVEVKFVDIVQHYNDDSS